MAFTTTIGSAAHPILVFTFDNVNSWAELDCVVPATDFERGLPLWRLVLRAKGAASTAQFATGDNMATYAVQVRAGENISSHVVEAIRRGGVIGGDFETTSMVMWTNPFRELIRAGDTIRILCPGDANASPIQDWEVTLEF